MVSSSYRMLVIVRTDCSIPSVEKMWVARDVGGPPGPSWKLTGFLKSFLL